jgi:hypothetical protein
MRHKLLVLSLAIAAFAVPSLLAAPMLMASPVDPPSASAAEDSSLPSGLERGFQNVPMADKPWAYWWWLKGNVT